MAAGLLVSSMVAEACLGLGWTDPPGRHKTHQRAVALGGVLYTLPLLFLLLEDPGGRLFWPGAAILVLGLWEDARKRRGGELPWPFRLGVFVLALASLWGHPQLFGDGAPAGVIALVLLLAAVISFNWFDHADGMCAGAGLGAVAGLMLLGRGHAPWFAAAAGLLCAFLWLNAYRRGGPLLFLGDAGAQVLGYCVTAHALLAGPDTPGPDLAVGLAAAGLPLLDAARVTLLRLSQGLAPWRPDRERHLGHLAARFTVPRGLLPLACACAAALWVWLAGR